MEKSFYRAMMLLEQAREQSAEREDGDCGSGMCDPNTGCPECTDRDGWTRRS